MERKIEEQLLAWKNKTDDRLPLIVNGARQVGYRLHIIPEPFNIPHHKP